METIIQYFQNIPSLIRNLILIWGTAFISFILFQNCKKPTSQSVDFSIKVHNHDEIDSLFLIGVDWETIIKFKLDEKGFFKTRIPLDSTVVGVGLFGRRNGKPTGDLFSLVLSQNGKSHYTIDDIYQAPETASFEGDLTKTNQYYLLKATMINAIVATDDISYDQGDIILTTVENEAGVKVSTIEHLMGALFGMNVDNALIEIDNEEVPILDGSAKIFVKKIQ